VRQWINAGGGVIVNHRDVSALPAVVSAAARELGLVQCALDGLNAVGAQLRGTLPDRHRSADAR